MRGSLPDISRSEWVRLIDEWILNDRDRRLIKRRLLDGITFDELAEEFSLSVRQTKKIVYKCTEKLIRCIDRS